MQNAAAPQNAGVDQSGIMSNLRRLIWLYMVLLLAEGALRKWIVPQFSNPLLIVRDPVVILIYILALRARVFPCGRFAISLGVIAVLSFLAGVLVLEPYIPWGVSALVTGYGFRANFFHLPLIFVIGAVLDNEDVEKVGWWMLLFMIPMGLLMVYQFKASPDAFINRTAGLGEAEQITAGSGKIRPPGSFSFASGPIYYVSGAAAFLLYGALTRFPYKNWLLFGAGTAIVVAVAVSGSRGLVVSVIVVILTIGVIFLLRPQSVNQFGRTLVLVVIAGLIISHLPIFKEGAAVLSERFATAAEGTESTVAGGLIERTLSGFTEGFKLVGRVPFFGYGLGVGTNVGAQFLTGRAGFLLAEGEWARVLLESGSLFGTAFLIWRILLAAHLGYLSLRALNAGQMLPILLFSAGFFVIANGPFGQPTSLGFAVVFGGLCLAATRSKGNAKEISARPAKPSPGTHGDQRMRGRSVYADRLHGPRVTQDRSNGSLDRRSPS
ncbi:MAG TPA: hypothetical protein VGQ82_05135 [Chthoniobacterales bacterium]|nr:hypothetical protein [Chthoniobacterales bacterium]